MEPDAKPLSGDDESAVSGVPPLPSGGGAPECGEPPRLPTAAQASAAEPVRKSSAGRQSLAFVLSVCLGLFLADGVVSLADDSLALFLHIRPLGSLRTIVFLFAVLFAVVVYVMMAITPMVPKRVFLPVTLFNPVAALAGIPLFIYFYGWWQQVAWVISGFQVLFGLGILWWLRGGLRFEWPLIAESQLGSRRFSWLNLGAFLLINVFALVPAVLAYLVLCVGLAMGHFSDGFLTLRPGGLTVEVRTYVREDGKMVQLVPMAHVGDAGFYRELTRSFPTNSLILMEGVTDNRSLLTNAIRYEQMATSLGLAEQEKEFQPRPSAVVPADIDVEEFTTNTIAFLNLAMLIHTQGVNAETLRIALEYSPPPQVEKELLADLIGKRNRRLLEELQARLPESDHLIVPWGVAHMPGIAAELRKSGFRLAETRKLKVIRFNFL